MYKSTQKCDLQKRSKGTDKRIRLWWYLPIFYQLECSIITYFSGDLTEWSSFKDLFTYLVDSANLSDTLNFYQLRNHLKGTALDTIKEYQMVGHNFQQVF